MRFRPLLWPTLIAVPMFVVMIGLGAWQLQRLEWKLGLIAQMQERMTGPLLSAPQLAAAIKAGGSADYYRLVAQGQFLPGRQLFWFTAGLDGEPGYHVIAPLLLQEGQILLVDRGFIPLAAKDAPGAFALASGAAIIHGIARDSQHAGSFTPDDEPQKQLIFARNVAVMARELGVSNVVPFFVEADAKPDSSGYPKGGQTRVTLRNEHLQYALTWFGLAATLLAVYFIYHKSQGRLVL